MPKRIPEDVLTGNYRDGTDWDARLFNKALNILIAGINANYDDILAITDLGVTGTFVSSDNKLITVTNGIITGIEEQE